MTRDTVVSPFLKDLHFEDVLTDINKALAPFEIDYVSQFRQPEYPTVLIAGTQRSGTTLLLQLLIAAFNIGYVNNLMARFWMAPYIGALLARELRRKQRPRPLDFTSELGATYGYDGPHEFGYFWQRWFPYNETHQASDEDLMEINFDLFRRELAAVESVFDAPLAFKNPIVFSLNIVALAEVLPKAVFVICRRNPIYVAQSTLLSRIKFHGRKHEWLSVKPQEYPWLKNQPYAEQIAGQIFYTEKRIHESLAKIDCRRYLTVEYENLCTDPERELERVRKLMVNAGHDLAPTDFRPSPFKSTNVQRVDDTEFRRLQDACDRFWSPSSGKEMNRASRLRS